MTGPDQLAPIAVGEPVRDVVTGKEGAVLWVAPAEAEAASVLVRWSGGDRSAYGAEEIGSRLVRWQP